MLTHTYCMYVGVSIYHVLYNDNVKFKGYLDLMPFSEAVWVWVMFLSWSSS